MKLNSFSMLGFMGDFLALIAGAMLTLAFAPFSIYVLAIFSLTLLYFCLRDISLKRSFYRGWLYGLGLFGTGVYWVYISIHSFGNASSLLAAFITYLFIAFLAQFTGLLSWCLNRFFPFEDENKILFAYPALFVSIEWLRSIVFTGFPWLLVGTSQINSPLRGFAPLIGVYGISLIVLFLSGLLVCIVLNGLQKNYSKVLKHGGLFIFLMLLGLSLQFIPWTKPEGPPIKISLVQGNISQDRLWEEGEILNTLQTYQRLTDQHWDSKIIIWPENAIPLPLQSATEYIDMMETEARKYNTTIISGIPIKKPNQDTYYNAIITFGHDTGYYIKQRLVPFGEYTPFSGLLGPVMKHFQIPMSNMTRGKTDPNPLIVQGLKIAPFICYEIAFPELVLSRDGKVDMLLTVSNDAWFGDSIALAQHIEMAAMRALELGRPLLFVSNTGMTAFINADGKIISSAPPFTPYVLSAEIQKVSGRTAWQKLGMDTVFVGLFLFFIYAIRSQSKQRKK